VGLAVACLSHRVAHVVLAPVAECARALVASRQPCPMCRGVLKARAITADDTIAQLVACFQALAPSHTVTAMGKGAGEVLTQLPDASQMFAGFAAHDDGDEEDGGGGGGGGSSHVAHDTDAGASSGGGMVAATTPLKTSAVSASGMAPGSATRLGLASPVAAATSPQPGALALLALHSPAASSEAMNASMQVALPPVGSGDVGLGAGDDLLGFTGQSQTSSGTGAGSTGSGGGGGGSSGNGAGGAAGRIDPSPPAFGAPPLPVAQPSLLASPPRAAQLAPTPRADSPLLPSPPDRLVQPLPPARASPAGLQLCGVCNTAVSRDTLAAGDSVACGGCHVVVHRTCYHVPRAPRPHSNAAVQRDAAHSWRCAACICGRDPLSLRCCLCPCTAAAERAGSGAAVRPGSSPTPRRSPQARKRTAAVASGLSGSSSPGSVSGIGAAPVSGTSTGTVPGALPSAEDDEVRTGGVVVVCDGRIRRRGRAVCTLLHLDHTPPLSPPPLFLQPPHPMQPQAWWPTVDGRWAHAACVATLPGAALEAIGTIVAQLEAAVERFDAAATSAAPGAPAVSGALTGRKRGRGAAGEAVAHSASLTLLPVKLNAAAALRTPVRRKAAGVMTWMSQIPVAALMRHQSDVFERMAATAAAGGMAGSLGDTPWGYIASDDVAGLEFATSRGLVALAAHMLRSMVTPTPHSGAVPAATLPDVRVAVSLASGVSAGCALPCLVCGRRGVEAGAVVKCSEPGCSAGCHPMCGVCERMVVLQSEADGDGVEVRLVGPTRSARVRAVEAADGDGDERLSLLQVWCDAHRTAPSVGDMTTTLTTPPVAVPVHAATPSDNGKRSMSRLLVDGDAVSPASPLIPPMVLEGGGGGGGVSSDESDDSVDGTAHASIAARRQPSGPGIRTTPPTASAGHGKASTRRSALKPPRPAAASADGGGGASERAAKRARRSVSFAPGHDVHTYAQLASQTQSQQLSQGDSVGGVSFAPPVAAADDSSATAGLASPSPADVPTTQQPLPAVSSVDARWSATRLSAPFLPLLDAGFGASSGGVSMISPATSAAVFLDDDAAMAAQLSQPPLIAPQEDDVTTAPPAPSVAHTAEVASRREVLADADAAAAAGTRRVAPAPRARGRGRGRGRGSRRGSDDSGGPHGAGGNGSVAPVTPTPRTPAARTPGTTTASTRAVPPSAASRAAATPSTVVMSPPTPLDQSGGGGGARERGEGTPSLQALQRPSLSAVGAVSAQACVVVAPDCGPQEVALCVEAAESLAVSAEGRGRTTPPLSPTQSSQSPSPALPPPHSLTAELLHLRTVVAGNVRAGRGGGAVWAHGGHARLR